MDLTFIEVMPLGDVGEGRLDQYLPLSMVRARSQAITSGEHNSRRRREPRRKTRTSKHAEGEDRNARNNLDRRQGCMHTK
jgi:molybdenum cofactor biosynthesis enzyme MoaA